MGIVGGITLIIEFFIELLVFNRWVPSLAISGVIFTLLFVYWHWRFYVSPSSSPEKFWRA
jgi:hypothetical protein